MRTRDSSIPSPKPSKHHHGPSSSAFEEVSVASLSQPFSIHQSFQGYSSPRHDLWRGSAPSFSAARTREESFCAVVAAAAVSRSSAFGLWTTTTRQGSLRYPSGIWTDRFFSFLAMSSVANVLEPVHTSVLHRLDKH
jgi:hypothetical protein